MNRKTFVIFLLAAAIVALGLGSCRSNKGPIDLHNSINRYDWEGVYTGTLLSAGGQIVDVSMKLTRDQRFEFNYEYVDGSYESFNFGGPFQWDDTGSVIMIDVIDAPVHYKVTKNELIRLEEENGRPIPGKLNYNYVLKKVR
jgi:uncharacterized lipoprotein NlpE involved in copper resistance